MAQSFNMISVSLGEAERQNNGHAWTDKDYKEHEKYYNIDSKYTNLNSVLVSANGLTERELVNKYFEKKMIELNDEKVAKVKKWNDEHYGQINPKTKKLYHKKSVDKRQMFSVGDYAGKGKRQNPYDTFKQQIMKGNIRAKESGRTRESVLQQAVVGLGNSNEWSSDPTRQILLKNLKNSNNRMAQIASKELLEDSYFKPFLQQFQKENPSLHIVQAVVHYDESHPHMQFTFLANVPGDEYGGLGSVGYTTALKHDHPDLPKNDIIGSVYRHEHSVIRDLIANQKPFERVTSFGEKRNNKMKLGERPGSHKSIPVDSRKKLLDTVNKQMAFIAKENVKLDERKQQADLRDELLDKKSLSVGSKNSELKTNLVDSIEGVSPSHTLPPERTNGVPEPVNTKAGYQQHMQQSSSFLVQLLNKLLARVRQLLQNEREELEEKRANLPNAYQMGYDDAQVEQIELNHKMTSKYSNKSAKYFENQKLQNRLKLNNRSHEVLDDVPQQSKFKPKKPKDNSKENDDGFEL